MALEALGAYAQDAYSPRFNVDIDVKNGAQKHNFAVSPSNALVLQSQKVATVQFSSVLMYQLDLSGNCILK